MSTKLPPVHKASGGPGGSQSVSYEDDSHSAGSSSKLTPQPPAKESVQRKTAIDLLDEEIVFLKEKLEEQRKVRERADKRLAEARKKEALCNADRRKTRVADARRLEAAKTIQRGIRRYFIRRYMASTVDASTVALKAAIAADPEILPDQLQSLQQSIHDLVFADQDKDQAAITIQSWWRMALGQRLFRVHWIAEKVRAVGVLFNSSATSIQAWWRGHLERMKYLELIREVTEKTRCRMVADAELHLLCILRVQRAFRGRLARREAARRKQRIANLHGEDAAAAASLSKTAPARVPWPKPPVVPSEKKRAEFENLANNGLIPFYWTATEVVKHKIGGHAWLGSNHAARKGIPLDDLDDLGEELYDVYPEGISEDFRGLLTVAGEKKKTKRKRKKSQKPSCPVVINYQESWKLRPVPSNSEQRAQARAERKAKEQAAQEEDGFDVDPMPQSDAHPLLFFNQPLPTFALD